MANDLGAVYLDNPVQPTDDLGAVYLDTPRPSQVGGNFVPQGLPDYSQNPSAAPVQDPRQKLMQVMNNSPIHAVTNVLDSIGEGLTQGAADIGTGIYNIADRGLHTITGQPLRPEHITVDKNPSYPLLYDAGSLATSFATPEIKLLEGAISAPEIGGILSGAYDSVKGLPYIGKAVSMAKSLVNPAATRATYDTVYGANDDDRPISSNLLRDSLLGVGLHVATRVPSKVGSAYVRHVAKDPGLETSPQKAQEFIKNGVDGGNTSLGDFVGSPKSKRFYNWLSGFPGSSSYASANSVKAHFENAANMLHDELKGNTLPGSIKKDLASAVKNNFDSRNKVSKSLYEDAFDYAKNNKDKFIPNEVSKFSDDPDIARFLKGENNDSLQEAHFVRSNLRDDQRDALSRDDRKAARALQAPIDAISKDIELSASPEFLEKYRSASRHYANEVAPYRSSSKLLHTISGGKDNPGNLSNYLLKRETPEVGKVLSDLSPEQKNLAFLDRLKNATYEAPSGEQETNAMKFWNKYKNTPEDAKDVLLSPEMRNKFRILGNLEQITRSDRIRANPPLTGFQLRNTVTHSPELAGATYSLLHNPALAIPVSLATVGSMSALARLLRSPVLKEGYTKGGINRLTKPGTKKAYLADYLSSGRVTTPIAYMGSKDNDN